MKKLSIIIISLIASLNCFAINRGVLSIVMMDMKPIENAFSDHLTLNTQMSLSKSVKKSADGNNGIINKNSIFNLDGKKIKMKRRFN